MSRDRLPLRADFSNFFRRGSGRGACASGNAFCLHFRWLAHRRGCTTPVWRCSRHGDDEWRDRSVGSLRPRNLSVPSDRPLHRGGCTGAVRQFVSGAGEGQHTSTRHDYRRSTSAGADVQAQATGAGQKGLWAPPRSMTQRPMHGRATLRRRSPWGSREAYGSSAPRPWPLRHWSISNAGWRCNR